MSCQICKESKAIILRPRNKMKVCKECFFKLFEEEIHNLIMSTKMFKKNSRVGIGISGGKDSTVLAYVLNKLNIKHKYDIELILLCIDEGIEGYRDKSIEAVIENQRLLGLELKILSYKEIFGTTMDEVVRKIGKKGNCMYCGVFRRQALEEAARIMNVDYIVTGHNADDMAETVLLNFLRGDISRLKRCTLSKTKENIKLLDTNDMGVNITKDSKNIDLTDIGKIGLGDEILSLSRCKPFKCIYQKEIVFYAYFKKLLYFSTECTYAPNASRGDARLLIKNLEKIDSEIILNIIKAGEDFNEDHEVTLTVRKCIKCSHPTSSKDGVCTACGMIEKLSRMSFGNYCSMN